MPSVKRKFGDLGEKIAEEYLTREGYRVIEKNYLKPWGEIDLISKKDNSLVFFEVKTRDSKNVEHYSAESAINKNKIRKLQKICETYLSERKYDYNQEWQIDVLAISINRDTQVTNINHIKNAVWERPY